MINMNILDSSRNGLKKRLICLIMLLIIISSLGNMDYINAISVKDYLYDTHVTPNQIMVSDFETISQWTKGSGGTMVRDTINFKEGLQGIKLTSPSSAINCFMTKTIAINFINNYLRIWVYIDDIANLGELRIYISKNSSFADFITNNLYQFLLTYPLITGWNEIVIPFDSSSFTKTSSGGYSFYNIMTNAVRIRLRITAKSSTPVSVTFDDLQMVQNQFSGAVTIMFDDNYINTKTYAYTKMEQYGYNGVIALSPNTQIGGANYLKVTDDIMLYQKGWDIIGHGYNHTNFLYLTSSGLVENIIYNQKWMMQQGFNRSAFFISAPYHGWNETIANTIDDYYTFFRCRSISSQVETSNPLNPDKLKVKGILNTVTLSTAKTLMNNTKAFGNWAIILFHHLVVTPTVETEWSISDFNDLIDYIHSIGLRVITMSDKYYELTNVPIWITKDRLEYFIDSGNYTYQWRLKSGISQTAYQIQFDDELGFNSLNYDSGKVISNSLSASIQPPTGDAFYIRVMIWDNSDNPSIYSNYIQQFNVFTIINKGIISFFMIGVLIFVPIGLVLVLIIGGKRR